VDAAVAERWPELADAAWFAPIADGFASNLGTGAADETTAAVAAATSGAVRVLVHDIPDDVPPGLWCYRVDAGRSLLGGALADVGRVVSWLQGTVRLGDEDLDELLAAPPAPGSPLVLPYLSGERSTGWAASARAVVTGVSTATDGAAIARGAMEGVALSYARIADQLRAAVGDPRRIRAGGRVTQDLPGWLQVLADVLGAPVEPVTAKRTTLRGTALHALDVLAPDTARAPLTTGEPLEPVAAHTEHYRERARAYDRLYRAVVAEGDRAAGDL
jgi:gluconokinase